MRKPHPVPVGIADLPEWQLDQLHCALRYHLNRPGALHREAQRFIERERYDLATPTMWRTFAKAPALLRVLADNTPGSPLWRAERSRRRLYLFAVAAWVIIGAVVSLASASPVLAWTVVLTAVAAPLFVAGHIPGPLTDADESAWTSMVRSVTMTTVAARGTVTGSDASAA